MNDLIYDKEKSSYFKKISFEDIDIGVLLFFINQNYSIQKQDETKNNVPVIFTTEERWKKADISSEYIDSNKKIITPLLSLYRIGSFEINKSKNVFSGNNGTNITVYKEIIPNMSSDFKRPFNNPIYKKNINKEVYRVIKIPYPKFYDLQYTLTIVTNMISHMNQILEQIYNNEYFFWMPINNQYGFNCELSKPEITENDISADERRFDCNIVLTLNAYINNPKESEIMMYETNTRFQMEEKILVNYDPPLGVKPKNVLPQ